MFGLFSTALTDWLATLSRCFSPSSVNKAAVFLSLQAHSSHTHITTKKNSVQTWQKTKTFQKKKRKKRQRFQLRSSKTYLSVADSRGQQKQRGDTSRQHLDADKQKRRKQKVRFSEETWWWWEFNASSIKQDKTWNGKKKLLSGVQRYHFGGRRAGQWAGRTGAAGLGVCQDGGEQEVRDRKKSEERWGIRARPPVSPPPPSPPGQWEGLEEVEDEEEEEEDPRKVCVSCVCNHNLWKIMLGWV